MPPSQPSKAPGETESGSASAPGPHDPAIGAPFINLEHVLDRISDAFIVCEKDWRIAYVNRSYLDLIAPIYSSADQILGGNLWEKFPDIVDSPTGRFYREAMEHQVAGTHELYYPPVQAWLQVRAMPTPEALTLYIRNISAQKTAERALQKRSERMQLLSETLRQLLAAVDPNTIVRELFAKVAAHLEVDTYFNFMVSPDGNRLRLHSCAGIPPEAALNLSTLEFGQAVCGTVAEIRRPIIATDVQNSDWDKCQVIRGFGIQTYACNPLMVGDKLLGTLSFGSRLRPNFDEDELEFIRVVTQSAAVALDRLHQAQRIRESEALYRATGESINYGVWVCDGEGRNLYASESFLQLLGISQEECTNLGWKDYLHPDEAENTIAAWEICSQTGTFWEREHRFKGKDGEWHPVLARGVPVRDANGAITRWVGINLDISLLKRNQEALATQKLSLEVLNDHLQNTADRLNLAMKAAKLGDWVWNTTSDIVTFSPAAAALFGIAPGPVMPWNEMQLMLEQEDRDPTREAIHLAQTLEKDYDVEYRVNRPDGVQVWVAARGRATFDDKGQLTGMLGVVQDITERKKAQEAVSSLSARIARQAHLFDATLSHIADLAYTFDCQGRVIYANRPLLEIWGLTMDQAIGKNCHDLGYPADLANQLHSQLLEVASSGRPVQGETELQAASGQIDTHEYIYNPVLDERGFVVAVAGTTRLITARKQVENELKSARDTAEAANRAKDRFLAVLSHELRTPLNPVLMTVTALELDPDLDPSLREELSMIRRNVELETKLIDDLLDLSRITSGKLKLQSQEVDLNATIHLVCSICQPQILEKGIHLATRHHASSTFMQADPARLQQVLWNVLKNAVKFTPAGGDVSITTRQLDTNQVEIRIQDSGIGIPAGIGNRIFDAFEQGDPSITRQFGGLGLGLAISKALVELHQGNIRAESSGEDQGATIIITLPLPRQETSSTLDSAPSSSTVSGTGRTRLLIAEDHADTARTLARLLTKRGFDVKVAPTVASALDLARSETFDLLISDIGLPDATGHDLMRNLTQIQPVRGIAMSGYGMEEDLERSRAAGFNEHLTKPVSIAHLEQAIARLLATGSN